MILLNWLLALGALAFTVPLVIHLLYRTRFEVVFWGAMRFLETAVRQNRRRIRLRNLLLLLVRCAIPILLALAMARPVLTGWQRPPGDQPVALAIALDTSYSTAATREDGRRRLDGTVEAARQIVSSLARASEVTLITGDRSERTGDPATILAALESVEIGGGPLDLERLVGAGLRSLGDSTLPARQLILLSDNRAADFSQAALDSLPRLRGRAESLAPAPSIAWIDAAADYPQPPGNRRLLRAEPAAAVAVVGQTVPWRVEARIEELPDESVEIIARIDGEIAGRRTVTVRGGAAAAVIPLQFDRSGNHAVEFTVAGPRERGVAPDHFPADDSLLRNFPVLDPLRVQLVDGRPGAGPLEGAADFLAIALSPFSLAPPARGERPPDLFRTQKVRAVRLPRDDDAGPQVIVLADVRRPTPDAARQLTRFVTEGGTLVIFAGPSVEPDAYSLHLITEDGLPLLPMRFGEQRSSDRGLAVDARRLTYPPLASLAESEREALAEVEVKDRLELLPHDDADAEANVVLRLENGEPLVAVSAVGRGRVMQVATTADPSWTNLPLRPVFVPLIQRLLLHLAAAGRMTAETVAGQPLVLSGIDPDTRWTVTAPSGRTRTLVAQAVEEEAAAGRLVHSPARQAGVYRFQSEAGETRWAAVNVPSTDRRPETIDTAMMQEAAERLGASYYASVDGYLSDESTRRYGRGIWHWVLAALLAAMILEPIIQQRPLKAGL